jgi:RNA polymerase sigma-70 factor (ECF subfamily)
MSAESPQPDVNSLLDRARRGDLQAIGELLNAYRPYLSLLARLKSSRLTRTKLSDSDLVQETCLSAHRDFSQFRGATEQELTAWLRQIMAHLAANVNRDFRRQRRDVRLEREFSTNLNESSQMLDRACAHAQQSPSQAVIRREQAVILANALEKLPAIYREVLVMRELQGVPLSEIALRVDRTPNATQKVWARAVVQLRRLIQIELGEP